MSKKKILIVEDTQAIRLLLCHILKKAGYETFEAENGAVAYGILSENPDLSLIILDLMMPVMDGLSFLEKFGEELREKEIPVCVLSALGDHQKILDAVGKGAVDYAIKPVDKDILLDKVSELIDSSGGVFAKVKANFLVSFKGIDEKFHAQTLSEISLTIESENPICLPSSLIIQDCYLNQLSESSEGIIVKTSEPKSLDGKHIVELKFIGLKEVKRSKIRSLTVKGEEINEAA